MFLDGGARRPLCAQPSGCPAAAAHAAEATKHTRTPQRARIRPCCIRPAAYPVVAPVLFASALFTYMLGTLAADPDSRCARTLHSCALPHTGSLVLYVRCMKNSTPRPRRPQAQPKYAS